MVFSLYFAYVIKILPYPSQAVHQCQIQTFCLALHLSKFHHHVKVDQILIQKLS